MIILSLKRRPIGKVLEFKRREILLKFFVATTARRKAASLRRSVTSLHESVTDTHKSAMIAWSLMTKAAGKALEFKRG